MYWLLSLFYFITMIWDILAKFRTWFDCRPLFILFLRSEGAGSDEQLSKFNSTWMTQNIGTVAQFEQQISLFIFKQLSAWVNLSPCMCFHEFAFGGLLVGLPESAKVTESLKKGVKWISKKQGNKYCVREFSFFVSIREFMMVRSGCHINHVHYCIPKYASLASG